MTRNIVVGRFYNEQDYIDLFLNYYRNHGVDEIIIFDSGSTDRTKNKILEFEYFNIRSIS